MGSESDAMRARGIIVFNDLKEVTFLAWTV